jgi:hypothetical protein
MCRALSLLSSLDWVAIASLIVAAASFVIARKTLKDAEEDWRQRKWFDLYLKADEAYNALDRYQTIYKGSSAIVTVQQENDWNDLMFLVRLVHSMAAVFPRNPDIDKLFSSTDSFTEPANAFQGDRLPNLLEASEGLRKRALIKPSVLG